MAEAVCLVEKNLFIGKLSCEIKETHFIVYVVVAAFEILKRGLIFEYLIALIVLRETLKT